MAGDEKATPNVIAGEAFVVTADSGQHHEDARTADLADSGQDHEEEGLQTLRPQD
jgi:hypothetical protein